MCCMIFQPYSFCVSCLSLTTKWEWQCVFHVLQQTETKQKYTDFIYSDRFRWHFILRLDVLTRLSPVFLLLARGRFRMAWSEGGVITSSLLPPRPAIGRQGAHQSSVSVVTIITDGDVCVSAGSSSDKTSNHNRNAVCLLLSCYL